jgi:hypothetical protein
MNQRKIDDMIPTALGLLATPPVELKNIKQGEYAIDSEYFGYIASFGPSVIQAGIAKTLAFYIKETDSDRKSIIDFIKLVLIKSYNFTISYQTKDLLAIYNAETSGKTTLQKLAFTEKILESAIACKLAMNTYKKIKKQKTV